MKDRFLLELLSFLFIAFITTTVPYIFIELIKAMPDSPRYNVVRITLLLIILIYLPLLFYYGTSGVIDRIHEKYGNKSTIGLIISCTLYAFFFLGGVAHLIVFTL